MQRKRLLNITTLVTDLFLNVTSSKEKALVGRNISDLILLKPVGFRKRLLAMKTGKIIQDELIFIIDDTPKRYSMVVRKGNAKFIFVLIELERVYALMENVALYRKYAFTDNLTGALTRHGYWNELFELLHYAEKAGHNIGIIFADIDNLKKMNSDYGYKGGDAQIAEVSKTLRQALRKQDLLVRLGGDEFLALMPMRANDPLQLEKIANRMLVATRRNKELKTTISIGLQFITTEAITKILNSKDVKKSWDSYLDIVDEKIRIAKKSGKNEFISSLA